MDCNSPLPLSVAFSDKGKWKTSKNSTVKQAWLAFIFLIIFGVLVSTLIATSHYHISRLEKKMMDLKVELNQRSQEVEMRVRREVAEETETREMKKREVDGVADDEEIEEVKKRGANDFVDEVPMPQLVTMSSGVAFTRWGRIDCRSKDEEVVRVYHGIAASSHHTHTGGGGNYICLHGNISYGEKNYVEGNQGVSYLYGVEWRDGPWINSLFNLDDTMTNTIQYHSLACAVCLARGRYTQIMIPGRTDCPDGFTAEYKGYLMGPGHSDKHAGEYVCVDRKPQVIPGTEGNQQGASINMVETQCPSLLCQPVVAGREIGCVVCTI